MPHPVLENGLTPKQNAFVNEYVKTGNGTQAILKAGYKATYDTARTMASENLAKPNIVKTIEKRIAKHIATSEEILGELSEMALGDYSVYKSDKVKTLELMGKHRKLWSDQTQINIGIQSIASQINNAINIAVKLHNADHNEPLPTHEEILEAYEIACRTAGIEADPSLLELDKLGDISADQEQVVDDNTEQD